MRIVQLSLTSLIFLIPLVCILNILAIPASNSTGRLYNYLATLSFGLAEQKVCLLYLLFANAFRVGYIHCNALYYKVKKSYKTTELTVDAQYAKDTAASANQAVLLKDIVIGSYQILLYLIRKVYWYLYYSLAIGSMFLVNILLFIDYALYLPLSLDPTVTFIPLWLKNKHSVMGNQLSERIDPSNFLLVWLIVILLVALLAVLSFSKPQNNYNDIF